MQNQDRVSYMMLFCALMMVKNSRATVEESLQVVPLCGGAKHLAGAISNRDPILP